MISAEPPYCARRPQWSPRQRRIWPLSRRSQLRLPDMYLEFGTYDWRVRQSGRL